MSDPPSGNVSSAISTQGTYGNVWDDLKICSFHGLNGMFQILKKELAVSTVSWVLLSAGERINIEADHEIAFTMSLHTSDLRGFFHYDLQERLSMNLQEILFSTVLAVDLLRRSFNF